MLVTTPEETRRIAAGESVAVTRSWTGDCPYKQKDVIVLGAPTGGEDRPVQYMKVEVLSVRPFHSSSERLKGSEADGLAREEGFTSGHHWGVHWKRHFSDRDGRSFKLYRIRFRVVEVENKVVEVINAGRPYGSTPSGHAGAR